MENTYIQTYAPLAFHLSIRTESTVPALARNAINPNKATGVPALLAIGAASVGAAALVAVGLPAWVSIPLVAYPGYRLFRFAKDRYGSSHMEQSIRANHSLVRKAVDPIDVQLFADETAAIVSSHYGNQAWSATVNELRQKAGSDPYMYLATVFSYAPVCWRLSARRVYDQLLAGVVPAPGQR
ncbi:hypothetical protein [Pseudomonas aeruginosa]|uniref:hypothetical protein n=1 Tax=Pseudomonas aeruginosa TaxID=287 RepID=UPI003D062752